MNKGTESFTVKSHFEGRDPAVRQTHDRLVKAIRQFGPIVEEPKKTSIHIVNRSALAGVATRKSYLLLTIKSDRKLASPRIHRSEQTSASRFHHVVKLVSPTDVDDELVGWLRTAYQLSS